MKHKAITTALLGLVLTFAEPCTQSAVGQDTRRSMADTVLDAVRRAVPSGFPDLLIISQRRREAETTVLKARQALTNAEEVLAYAREKNNAEAQSISARAIAVAKRALRKAKQDISRITGLTLAADRAIETISRRIANDADASLQTKPGFHRDAVWEKRLAGLAQKLRKMSLKPGAPIRIRILDDPKPRGLARSSSTTVYLKRGYLESKPSDAELSFVLGHEIAHADLRHAALWSVRTTFDEETDWISSLAEMPTNNPRIDEMVRNAALRVRRTSYGRHQEFIADMVGTHTALEAGADPKGLKSMFERLTRHRAASAKKYPTPAEQKRAAQLSDHPSPDERRQNLKKLFGGRVRF